MGLVRDATGSPAVLTDSEVTNGTGAILHEDQSAFLSLFLADRQHLRGELVGLLKAEGFGQEDGALESRRLVLENRLYLCALESQAKAHTARMQEILFKGVHALAQALEAKDAYIWGHSARVSQYAVASARELGLSEAEIGMVSLAGELHDVGKIGVREDLLRKPGPLTPAEYRHVMNHTVIGTRILRPLLHDHHPVLSVVRSHHERVDGTGLPDRLRGEAIPLEARIVTVADAFDAMTSVRPYRSALSASTALRELEENAGSQFDAECVRAFQAAYWNDFGFDIAASHSLAG